MQSPLQPHTETCELADNLQAIFIQINLNSAAISQGEEDGSLLLLWYIHISLPNNFPSQKISKFELSLLREQNIVKLHAEVPCCIFRCLLKVCLEVLSSFKSKDLCCTKNTGLACIEQQIAVNDLLLAWHKRINLRIEFSLGMSSSVNR